jgi:hypothetical protein
LKRASKGQQVDARKEEQVFDLEAKGIDRVILRWNDRMVDMDRGIVVLSGNAATRPRSSAVKSPSRYRKVYSDN